MSTGLVRLQAARPMRSPRPRRCPGAVAATLCCTDGSGQGCRGHVFARTVRAVCGVQRSLSHMLRCCANRRCARLWLQMLKRGLRRPRHPTLASFDSAPARQATLPGLTSTIPLIACALACTRASLGSVSPSTLSSACHTCFMTLATPPRLPFLHSCVHIPKGRLPHVFE